MPFIGIIAKESESNFIKNEVLKNSVNNKFEFININRQNIQNIKNIRFETIVINEELQNFLKDSKYLEDILKNSKYIIINSDVTHIGDYFNEKNNIITYGVNQKAMITISSVEKEKILICVQKPFQSIRGTLIEQQEFNIEFIKNSFTKICNSMAIFAILTIYGEDLKKI